MAARDGVHIIIYILYLYLRLFLDVSIALAGCCQCCHDFLLGQVEKNFIENIQNVSFIPILTRKKIISMSHQFFSFACAIYLESLPFLSSALPWRTRAVLMHPELRRGGKFKSQGRLHSKSTLCKTYSKFKTLKIGSQNTPKKGNESFSSPIDFQKRNCC